MFFKLSYSYPFTLLLGGSKARLRVFGEGGADGMLYAVPALPGNSLTLVSDPPEGRVKLVYSIT